MLNHYNEADNDEKRGTDFAIEMESSKWSSHRNDIYSISGHRVAGFWDCVCYFQAILEEKRQDF